MQKRIEEEKGFQEYFFRKANGKNKNLIRCIALKKELFLYRAYDLLKREFYERNEEGNRKLKIRQGIGRVDMVFRYKSKTYCGEIKFTPFSLSDFWDALKILGYTTYLNWAYDITEEVNTLYPAILMPQSKIKLEHRIISNRLGILLLGIEKINNVDYRLITQE